MSNKCFDINWLSPNITHLVLMSLHSDQCYFTVQITGSNFEYSLLCNSTVIVGIARLLHII